MSTRASSAASRRASSTPATPATTPGSVWGRAFSLNQAKRKKASNSRLGLLSVPAAPHRELYKMPIRGEYCDAWFTACRHDLFCAEDNGDYFSCAREYVVRHGTAVVWGLRWSVCVSFVWLVRCCRAVGHVTRSPGSALLGAVGVLGRRQWHGWRRSRRDCCGRRARRWVAAHKLKGHDGLCTGGLTASSFARQPPSTSPSSHPTPLPRA